MKKIEQRETEKQIEKAKGRIQDLLSGMFSNIQPGVVSYTGGTYDPGNNNSPPSSNSKSQKKGSSSNGGNDGNFSNQINSNYY